MGRRLSGKTGTPINSDRLDIKSRSTAGDAPATGRVAIEVVGGRLHTRMPAEAAKGYAQVGEAQPIAKWLVADVAALAPTGSIGSVVTSADIGYVARVASPVSLWRLVSVGPAAWEQIGAPPTTDASQLTSGTLDRARLPTPTGLALGGVMRNTGAAGEFVRAIDASGALVYGVPSGGGSHTRGTWALRPASPAAGDSYLVTDVPETALRCFAAGQWSVFFRGVEVSPQNVAWFATVTNWGSSGATDVGPYSRLIGEPNATLWQIRTRTRSLPSSSNYTVEIGVRAQVLAHGAGIALYDATQGIGFGFVIGAGGVSHSSMPVFAVNSSHTWAYYMGTREAEFAVPASVNELIFLRIRDDGSHRHFETSVDRVVWRTVHTNPRTEHITATRWGPTLMTGRGEIGSDALIVHAAESTP